MADEQQTVSVTALTYHTRGAEVHPEGSTYKARPDEIDNLTALRLVRVNPVGDSPKAEAAPKPSTAVAPMTTETAPVRTHELKTTEVVTTRKTRLAAKRRK